MILPGLTSLFEDVKSGKVAFDRSQHSVGEYLAGLMRKEILIFDGGMGTMIQKNKYEEDDFRNGIERFVNWPTALKGKLGK